MTKNTVIIGLINPKSPTNVGAIIRAAGCYQAHEIRYTGVRYDRAATLKTDTKNISQDIIFQQVDDIFDGVPEGVKVVCVELVEGATPLPDFVHPDNALYIFGPEDRSIPQAVVNQADFVVYVPTIGCMNLAATVNVLLYDRLAKSKHYECGNKAIRDNRDCNNRLKIKR